MSKKGRFMAEPSAVTKQKILDSAKKEFLEKGFMNASLRKIACNAGLTTGAMYRHFKDKDALFCALVDDAIDVTTKVIMNADVVMHMNDPSPISQEHEEKEHEILYQFLNYIYDNFDAFTLLISTASGSTHEYFIDDMCELYTKNCLRTIDWLYEQKYATKKIDPLIMHVIATSLISAFTELISHKIPKDQAEQFVTSINGFFHYGTIHLMGIPH